MEFWRWTTADFLNARAALPLSNARAWSNCAISIGKLQF